MSLVAQIVLGLLEWVVIKGGDLVPIWMKQWQKIRAEERAIQDEEDNLKQVTNEAQAKKAVEEISSDINSRS